MDIKECVRPSTLEDVLDILQRERKNAQLIAGGTDLVIEIRHHKNRGSILVDLTPLKGLRFMEEKDHEIILGATTTFSDMVKNPWINGGYHGLWRACKSVGSPQIRNSATLGGNICNGSPAADAVPPLLALDAEVIIKSLEKTSRKPLKDFYVDKGVVDLRENEMLYAIVFPKIRKNQQVYFEKLGLRKALAIARISCSVFIELQGQSIREIRIATGALGKYPQREFSIEKILRNQILDEKSITAAEEAISLEVSRRLWGRSTMSFKRSAISGLFRRALEGAVKGVKNHDCH